MTWRWIRTVLLILLLIANLVLFWARRVMTDNRYTAGTEEMEEIREYLEDNSIRIEGVLDRKGYPQAVPVTGEMEDIGREVAERFLGTEYQTTYLDAHRSGDTTVDFFHDPRLFRADRLILSYPVITGGEYAHRGSFERLLGPTPEERALRWFSLETQVTAETPPTFLWQTATDDSVPVQNSLLFAQSLMQAHVPVELHIYPKGAHGLSLATEEVEQLAKGRLRDDHVAGWFDVMLDWLSYPI